MIFTVFTHFCRMDFRTAARTVRSVFVLLGRRMDLHVIRISGEQIIKMSIQVKGSTTGNIYICTKQPFSFVLCQIYIHNS